MRIAGLKYILTKSGDNPPLAATLMVCALFFLGLQDSIVKLASDLTSLWQFQTLRSSFNIVFLVLGALFIYGFDKLKPKRVFAVALRSCFMLMTMILFFGGVSFLSPSEMAAGLYIFPIFVAILSSLILKERVGPLRIVAILVGFLGTMLVIEPWDVNFRLVSLMPLGAGLCYAGVVITTRRLCREESPMALSLGIAFGFLISGSIGMIIINGLELSPVTIETNRYLLTGWNDLSVLLIGFIMAASILNVTSNVALGAAYQRAESSWLAPFDYSYLIWATFWTYIFWEETPNPMMILGMVLIAAGGAYVAWREAVEKKQEASE